MFRCLYPVQMKPLLLFALLTIPLSAIAAAPPKAAPAALLPATFADWKLSAPAHTATTPQAADATHAAVLQEDGLTQFATGTYAKPGGQTLVVRAFRFTDATGAYSAFTVYRQPAMHPADSLKLQNAATEANHFLLWRGATVVDCTFTKGDAAPDALQALAAALPPTGGTAGIPPPLPTYLPPDAVPGSEHYSIGPASYAASGNPVPAEVIDFSRDAEVVSGTYRAPGGNGQLTLVMYPTPQMAVNRERALTAMAATLGPGFEEKRFGAMLAYTTGPLSKPEADKLFAGIRYKTEVIVDHPEGYVSEVAKAAKLLLGIGYLTGILGVAAVILAIFLGAGRVLVRRLRGKPLSSMNDDDFISLKIDG
jgi:hypothetical protein